MLVFGTACGALGAPLHQPGPRRSGRRLAHEDLGMKFRTTALAATFALGLGALPLAGAGPALAIGCVSGAVAGAVAGHYAHHHAIAGAIGGCIVGHHMKVMERRKEAEEKAMQASPAPTPAPTSKTY